MDNEYTTNKSNLLNEMKLLSNKITGKTMDLLKNNKTFLTTGLIGLTSIIGFTLSHNSMDVTSSLERLKFSLEQLKILDNQIIAGLRIISLSITGNIVTKSIDKTSHMSYSKKEKKVDNTILSLCGLGIAACAVYLTDSVIDPERSISLVESDLKYQFDKIRNFLSSNPNMKDEVINMLHRAGVPDINIKNVFDKLSVINENKERASNFVQNSINQVEIK